MPTIIDELVVLVKLSAKQAIKETKELEKAVEQTAAAVQNTNKKTADSSKVSAADRKRIEDSQAQRAAEREKNQEKQRKDVERQQSRARADKLREGKKADRESAKSKQELGDKVKGVALSVAGAFLGFESFLGAVKFLGALNTSTAALGRNSQNLGTSSQDLQTWGNAVEQVGGDAKEAQTTFAALSQTLTGFKLRGESSPLLQLFQNMGVYVRDAKGNVKDLTQLLGELGAAMQKRGLSRADAFNLAQGAGISEGVFNVLYDKNSAAILANARSNAFADAATTEKAQKLQTWFNQKKQGVTAAGVDWLTGAIDHPGQTYLDAVVSPITAPYNAAVAGTTDLFSALFGEKGASLGVRNNNPGNIEDKFGKFKRYVTMKAGAVALGADLDYKIDRDGLKTIRKIISKYAPSSENDTAGYISEVSKSVGLGADDEITSAAQRSAIISAIIRREQGAKGAAQVSRALATPGLAGSTTNTRNGGDVNFHGDVNINSQASGGSGVATDFMGAMQRKGVLSQANSGMT